MRIKDMEKLTDQVAKWLFGDHGPFGWNDHACCQRALSKMDKYEISYFVTTLAAKIERRINENS